MRATRTDVATCDRRCADLNHKASFAFPAHTEGGPTLSFRLATLVILALSVAWWLAEPSYEPVITAVAAIAGLFSAEAVTAARSKRGRGAAADRASRPVPDDAAPLSFVAPPHTVGRQDVLDRLRRDLGRLAEEGSSRFVCITGEAGLGKTTVAENFLSELSPEDFTIARGRCSERLAGAEAYLPLLEALESMLRGPRTSEVGDLMRRMAPSWCAQLAPPTDTTSEPSAQMAIPQERLKREIARFLEGLTRHRPLILLLEDLHWADVATVDVLRYVADRFDSIHTIVLTTYRPQDMRLSDHPFLHIMPTLEQRGLLAEIPLGFLHLRDIEHYVALEYPEHSFPAAFASAIHRRTEGSPLFVVALLRHLRDLGVIVLREGSWSLTRPIDEVEASFPKTLAGTIARKIERLDESARELLGVAAVQGYEFDAAVIAEPLDLEVSRVEQDLRTLDHDHALIERMDDRILPDGSLTARYEFVHVLYQHGLLESIGPTRRAAWSRCLAEALIAHDRDDSPANAAEIGLLFEAARDFGRAAGYLQVAAREALRFSAPTEAVALCRHALKLLDTASREPGQDALRLHLLTDLGSALMLTAGWGAPEVIEVYQEALELARKVDVASGLPRLIIQALWYRWTRREAAEIPALLADLHSVAEQTGEPSLRQYARWTDANVEFWRGYPTAALPVFDEAMSLYKPGQDDARFVYGQDSHIATSSYASWNLCLAGYPDRARDLAATCIAEAEKLEHPHSICYALVNAPWVSILRGDTSDVLERTSRNVELAEQLEIPFVRAYAGIQHGWALAHLGRGDEGLTELLTNLEQYERSAVLGMTYFLALLADVCGLTGRPEEGLDSVERALEMSTAIEEYTFDAELHRLQGELIRLRGADGRSVETCYRTALEIAREQESRWLELRAATSLAAFLRDEGRQVEAKGILQPTYGWFTEGFETLGLKEAANLLRTLA